MVIKVCDIENGQRCPIFPLTQKVLEWSLPDPRDFEGTDEEKLIKIRVLRDEIKELITNLVDRYKYIDANSEAK